MIDLSKVNDLLSATNGLAQAQQQLNAQQAAAPQQAAQSQQSAPAPSPEAAAMFAQLGQLLTQANAAQGPTAQNTSVQRQAALVSAKVKALMAKANAMEDELNLAPTPDTPSVDELFAQFKEIMAELNEEMSKLRKEVEAKKEESAMKVEQKPTAVKAGEDINDPSFNSSLSVV